MYLWFKTKLLFIFKRKFKVNNERFCLRDCFDIGLSDPPDALHYVFADFSVLMSLPLENVNVCSSNIKENVYGRPKGTPQCIFTNFLHIISFRSKRGTEVTSSIPDSVPDVSCISNALKVKMVFQN